MTRLNLGPTAEQRKDIRRRGRERGPHPLVAQLRQVRLDLGLTQVQVAEDAGMAQPTLNEYERGAVTPGLHTFTRWAAALNQQVEISPIPAEDETHGDEADG